MRNLIPMRKSRFAAVLTAGTLAFGAASAPASAQQSGLVNVDVSDNTVQVPIAVAANVCDVQVDVLAQRLRQGPVDCEATADVDAVASRPGGSGGAGSQQGLVNLAITDNTIQVPVGIAANICGVQAAILAQDLAQGAATCRAEGSPSAS